MVLKGIILYLLIKVFVFLVCRSKFLADGFGAPMVPFRIARNFTSFSKVYPQILVVRHPRNFLGERSPFLLKSFAEI